MDADKRREVEVKLPFASAAEAREALQSAGALEVQPRLFEDNLVLDRGVDPLAHAGKLLRLRRYGKDATLTFKAPVPGRHKHKVREEHETLVADFDAALRILEHLGTRSETGSVGLPLGERVFFALPDPVLRSGEVHRFSWTFNTWTGPSGQPLRMLPTARTDRVDFPTHLPPHAHLPRFLRYTLDIPAAGERLRAFRPDLVNAHFLPNYGWMAARLGLRPLVLTALGSDILKVPNRTPLHRWRTRYVLSRCDRVTSDATMLSQAIASFGLPQGFP